MTKGECRNDKVKSIMHILTKELSITSVHYKEVLSALTRAGARARVIGGAVRDSLLNKANYDIDIAVDLLPERVIDILSKANIKVIPTGIKYGTVTALLHNEKFEITTLRKDVNCDGRYAEVEFTDDFMQDAARRDFTINALSYCPFEHKIYDYFSGIEDLYNAKVVFIGKAGDRIQEDYLRILRFFRFSSYYAKELDPRGFQACVELKENLKSLSKERIKWEMDKLVIADNSLAILQQMFDHGVLQIVFPVVEFDRESFQRSADLLHVIRNPKLNETDEFQDELAERTGVREHKKDPQNSLSRLKMGLGIRYSLLFYHIKDLALSTLTNLKFSRKESTKILSLITFAKQEHNDFTLKKVWLEQEDYQQYFLVLLALGKVSSSMVENFNNLSVKPLFPITGHDLQRMNIHGKDVGSLLIKLRNHWIESDFTLNRDQLLKLL